MQRNKQLAGIDLLRFAAAVMVMTHHLGFWIWSGSFRHYHDGGLDVSYHWLAPITWFGWIGVEVFFVLSGFVIAYSAEGTTALDFMRGRLLRLYPTAWVCSTLTFSVLLACGVTENGPRKLWLRASLLSPRGPWIDGSYWTLSVELGFYLVIFLLLAIKRFDWLGAVMTTIGIGSSFVSAAFWYLKHANLKFLAGLPLKGFYNGYIGSHWYFYFLLARHGSFFAIGTLLWLCLFRRTTLARIIAILVCIAGGLTEIVIHCQDIVLSSGESFPLYVPVALWLLTLAAIIASVKYKPAIDRALGVQGAKLLRALGMMTYPLYLIHQRAGEALIALGKGRIPDFASFLIVISLMFATAWLISAYPDKFLQRHLRNLLGVRPGAVLPHPHPSSLAANPHARLDQGQPQSELESV